MTIYLVLIGILICGIGLTSIQIRNENKKEISQLTELFEDVPK